MGEVDVPALREASLDIYDGELLVIVGPSGSGKSTLLNLVGGMDRPTSGLVTFLDQDLSSASDKDLTLYRRNEVGFVFQFYNLVPTLTALENVQVVVEIVPDPLDSAEVLTMVGLEDRAGHFPSQLSGGEPWQETHGCCFATSPPARWIRKRANRCCPCW
jgi:putative ABC transport system ATP-binding protein